MSDKPIIFSGPMVRALLDGRKTQTRRIINPQPVSVGDKLAEVLRIRCGDRLWVRESASFVAMGDGLPMVDMYKADANASQIAVRRWRPSIHMPRWASRITLEVAGVRIERLQDISEADAIAEGCRPFFDHKNTVHVPAGDTHGPFEIAPHVSAVEAFSRLWNSINGDGSWHANPWVAAYTFRVSVLGHEG